MARTALKAVTPEVPKGGLRISITVDPTLRKNMRIAAALSDQTVGEWALDILEKAADRATTR
jgi:hypothetical protein